ncbi:Protein mlo2 [Candida viswanathii]|uniref:Protein mlo2 n=1 Tax=Candida viswanathii TaxID=5486 RepID=A0A367Y1Q9_9ASCO|nr:Protein mlo2 [Candida viswanathii]
MSESNPTPTEDGVVTAVDYIESQKELEKEARELMPYDPNECTYEQGELRQPVFACLTCSAQNDNEPIGVCYSCSIQCHLQHELVELFTKRSFECDCGTTRMKQTPDGACKLRRKGKPEKKERKLSNVSTSSNSGAHLELPAEDVPSESNRYNQNYHGKFCGCEQLYNPLEETGHMIQCYFGFTCGEDWYHDRCIMGVKSVGTNKMVERLKGENLLDKLPSPGLDAKDQSKQLKIEPKEEEDEEEDLLEKLKYFPKLEKFDEFICWKCVDQFKDVFEELDSKFPGVIMTKLPRFDGIVTVDDWYNKREGSFQPKAKKTKTENGSPSRNDASYSIFLGNDFRYKLLDDYESLDHDSKLYKFLCNNSYLFKDDPIFKPPEDESEDGWSTTDMGTAEALHSLPRDRAIESVQAYDKIRSKLREFFKPFAQQGKIVTEDEVRNFFGHIDDKAQDSQP